MRFIDHYSDIPVYKFNEMNKLYYEKGFIDNLIDLYIHSNTLIVVKHNLIMKILT